MTTTIDTTAGGTEMATLPVALGARSYDILVGDDLLNRAGALIKPVLPQPRVVVVCDANVEPLYLEALGQSLDRAGIEFANFVLPAGESTKSFEHLQKIVDWMLDQRVERSTTVVALGGGVIGDIAGFAAGIVLRCLPVVQIPTTLLAQVDSSVGGKTGINAAQGKNLIGVFHQPTMVLADIGTLDTLPRRELLAGYAETIKYGLIEDPDFFEWLDVRGQAFCDGDKAIRRDAVIRACAAKAAVVAEDEFENGRRALLNFGHTFGHTLEKQAGYGNAVLHGEAVSIGMVMAMQASVELGLCPAADAERATRHLSAHGLPIDLSAIADSSWTADVLMSHMLSDKKVQAKRPTFVLSRGIGKAFTTQDVDPGFLHDFIEGFLQK
jgi:3-dehydroquinate synthase